MASRDMSTGRHVVNRQGTNGNGALDARRWRQPRGERDDLPLFDDAPTSDDTVTVRCSGCAATATEPRRHGLTIPFTWMACGEGQDGSMALWCRQCVYERLHERARSR
jgi:hypothetical protein